MKQIRNILLLAVLLIGKQATAQIDTASSPITVQLPVKAIIIYSYYLSLQPNWTDRKAPDQLLNLIGSGNNADSLVTATVTAGKLATFAMQLLAGRYGALLSLNKSVFNNTPVIAGYTPLTTQIAAKISSGGAQANAAIYIQNKYNAYVRTMTDLYNQMYASGLGWIRN